VVEVTGVPRQSPFVITLSKRDEVELRRRAARYTAPYMEVIRARIVLMAAQGMQNKDIAEKLMLPVQIVSKWRKRYYEEGLAGLEERARPGRPPARTSAGDARS